MHIFRKKIESRIAPKTLVYRLVGVLWVGLIFNFPLSQVLADDSADTTPEVTKTEKKRVAFMAALGDSLTAATLANTTAVESADHKKPVLERFTFLREIINGMTSNVSNLSWASGSGVNSHYVQLKSWMDVNEPNVDLKVQNFAVPGARSTDLRRQTEQLVREMKSGKYDYLKYVTLSIGGNDICLAKKNRKKTEAEVFQESLREFFAVLAEIKQAEPIFVFVSSIPNAPTLGRKEFLDLNVFGGYTCQWIRTHVHNSCGNLNNFTDEDGFNTSVETVVAQNAILRALTEEASANHLGIQTFYSDALFNINVTPDLLGYDCFHPNKRGQDLIGSSFQQQPFFR